MKIIYIVGLAHSGSTFFSRVLNQHSKIFTAGELYFLDEALSNKTSACKCVGMAEKNEACPFWDQIYEEFTEKGGDVAATGRLDRDNRLDWIKAVSSPFIEKIGQNFAHNNRLLYELISHYSDSPVIVDTSKRPWRLIPLIYRTDLDINILHLIKSPTNQIRSRTNRGYNFWHSAIMKYARKNLLSEYLGRDANYLKIRFEKFVKSPESVLNDVYDWTDLSSEPLFEKSFQPFHHLRGGGNKSLYDNLKPDPEELKKIDSFTGFKNKMTKILRWIY